jgi:hypothetical protein
MRLELVPNLMDSWLVHAVGLLAALAAGAIIRVGELPLALGLVLGCSLAVGLVRPHTGEQKMLDLPPGIPAHIPKSSHFLEMLALYSVFDLGIVALPCILRGLWNLGRHRLGS